MDSLQSSFFGTFSVPKKSSSKTHRGVPELLDLIGLTFDEILWHGGMRGRQQHRFATQVGVRRIGIDCEDLLVFKILPKVMQTTTMTHFETLGYVTKARPGYTTSPSPVADGSRGEEVDTQNWYVGSLLVFRILLFPPESPPPRKVHKATIQEPFSWLLTLERRIGGEKSR